MEEVIEVAGKHLNFIQNFRLGGVGSPRIYYKKGNEKIDNFFSMNNNIKVCNLQIRSLGFMFRFNDNTVVMGIPLHKNHLSKVKVYTLNNNRYSMGIDFHLVSEGQSYVFEFHFNSQHSKKMKKFLSKPCFENKVEWRSNI